MKLQEVADVWLADIYPRLSEVRKLNVEIAAECSEGERLMWSTTLDKASMTLCAPQGIRVIELLYALAAAAPPPDPLWPRYYREAKDRLRLK